MELYTAICIALLGDAFCSNSTIGTHPVIVIGRYALWVEAVLYNQKSRFLGALACIVVVSTTYISMYVLCSLPYIGTLLQWYYAYLGLSLGMLVQEARKALALLEKGSLPEARIAIGMLVSRDTSNMNAPLLYQSLAESVAENCTDACIAPLFWLCFGGVPLLWGYKAISTLDSMWGYKTKQYEYFGWCSAKADDCMAYIPARIACYFFWCTAYVFSYRAIPSLYTVYKEARQMQSPNSGWTMALLAHIHGGQMGGAIPYKEGVIYKPILGIANQCWNAQKISSLLEHIQKTQYVLVGIAVVVWIFVMLCS